MELTADQMEAMLTGQENRWWSIKIQSLGSKEHFLRYAGPSAVAPGVAHVTAVFQGVTSNAALVSVQAQVAIITSSPLPNGTQNQPYSFVMQANGGLTPYTWSVASGSVLPTGLNLASNGTLIYRKNKNQM